jgi:calcineurin-like phosphoesterase
MTGPRNGVLGVDAEATITKMRTHMPTRFKVADGEISADAVIFELDGEKVTKIERIVF